MLKHPDRVLHAILVLCGLSWAVFTLLSYLHFPGEPSACLALAPCWCETPTAGWVYEPWNTWSNLPVFACSIFVARLARDHTGTGLAQSPVYDRPLLIAFSYALWIQAAGAFFFHGALTQWSRVFDASSVLCVWGVVVLSSLLRLGLLKKRFLLGGIVASNIFAFIYRGVFEFSIDVVGLLCLISTLIMEVILSRRRERVSFLLYASLGLLALSMFFWNTCKPGGLLCGIVPGHAIWHLGMGGSVTLFGLHAARDLRDTERSNRHARQHHR